MREIYRIKGGFLLRLIIIGILAILASPVGGYLWINCFTNYKVLKNAVGTEVAIVDHYGTERTGVLSKVTLVLDWYPAMVACKVEVSGLSYIEGRGGGMISRKYRTWDINAIRILTTQGHISTSDSAEKPRGAGH
jgi:hypothetical protein